MLLTGWPIRSDNIDGLSLGIPPCHAFRIGQKIPKKYLLPQIFLNLQYISQPYLYRQMCSWNNLVAKIPWFKSGNDIQISNQSQQNLVSNLTGHPVLARPFWSFLFLLLLLLARVNRRLFSGRAATEKKGHLSTKHIPLIDLTSYFPQAHMRCRFHLAFSFLVHS